MSDTDKGNGAVHGNGAAATRPWITIEVVDPLTLQMHITGAYPNNDYALAMLAQATRELEAQWRLARAAAFHQELIVNAENERIRQELQKGR